MRNETLKKEESNYEKKEEWNSGKSKETLIMFKN